MIAWLALVAWGGPPTRAGYWEPVPAVTADVAPTPLLGGPARLLTEVGGAPLRLSCPHEDQAPHRAAIVRGVLVRDEASAARQPDGAWILPASELREVASAFVVAPATCSIQRLRADADAWAWAIAERRGTPLQERDAATEPLARVARRPPGPHPVGTVRALHTGRSVRLDGQHWTVQDAPGAFTVHGPSRVLLRLRAVGDLAPPRCLEVDGEQTCLVDRPARTVAATPDGLRVVDRVLPDGRAVGLQAVVRIGLGPGDHRVALPEGVLVRAFHHRFEPWASEAVEPGHTVLVDGPATIWAVAPTEGGAPVWLADADASRAPDAVRWFPVNELPAEAMPLELDRIGLWLADGPCRVTVEAQAFVTHAPAGLHDLRWLGAGSANRRPAVGVQDCAGWMRTTGADRGGRLMVRAHRLEPGEALVARTERSQATRVQLFVPAGTPSITLQASSEGGVVRAWHVEPLPGAFEPLDLAGGGWTASVALALPEDDAWTLQASQAVALRVEQELDPTAPAEVTSEPPEPPADAVVPDAEALRLASRSVADATSDADRVDALLRRAVALARADRPTLAMADLALAELLDPTRTDASELAARLRDVQEVSLFGEGWRPSSLDWVEATEPAADAVRAAAALRGDALGVALATPDPASLRWWRRAVAWGQVLDGSERLRAMAAVARAPDPRHPALATLRGMSTWRSLVSIEGAPRRAEVAWPLTQDDPWDDLWPEAWPARRAVDLFEGWVVRIPSGRAHALPVRCRAATLDRVPSCRVEVLDGRGTRLSSIDPGPWGAGAFLTVPAGGTRYVRMAGEDVRGQVMWPHDHGPDALRSAWQARGGRALAVTVLGPTLLRVEVFVPDGGSVTGSVEHDGGTTRVWVDGAGESWVPVTSKGPQRVRVTLDDTAWVRLALRRPRDGAPEPVAHRALMDTPAPPPVPAMLDLDLAPPGVVLATPPPARPAGVPRLTAIAQVVAGHSEPLTIEPWTWEPGRAGATGRVGLRARALDGAWVEGDLAIEHDSDGTTLGLAHAGADLRLDAVGRWTLVGDVHVATGGVSGRALVSSRGVLGAWLVYPAGRVATVEVRANARAQVRSGADARTAWPEDRSLLWSSWREQHRLTGDLLGAVRLSRGPWLQGRAALTLQTNAPGGGQPLEGATAELRADLARPGVFVRVLGAADLRFADADREATTVIPRLEATAVIGVWPGVRWAVRPWVWARLRPIDASGMLRVGVEGRWGAPRALDDDRPSRTPMPWAGAWGFHTRSLRDHPAPAPDPVRIGEARPDDDIGDRPTSGRAR